MRTATVLTHVLAMATTAACNQAPITFSQSACPQGAEGMMVAVRGHCTQFTATGLEVTFPTDSGIYVVGAEVLSNTRAEMTLRIPVDKPLGPQAGEDVMFLVQGSGTHFNLETFSVAVDVVGVEVLEWNVLSPTEVEVHATVDLVAEGGLYPGAVEIYTDWQRIDPTWARRGDTGLRIVVQTVEAKERFGS